MADETNENRQAFDNMMRVVRSRNRRRLLFEFHVAATHTFYRVELRDHGAGETLAAKIRATHPDS